MKKSRKREAQKAPAAIAKPRRMTSWAIPLAVAAALLGVFWAYSPAFHGVFLFDDNVLPFALPNVAEPLKNWITGVRPVLMFSYWINAHISGEDTFSYHIFNLIIHCITSGLIFVVARRLLQWSEIEEPRPGWLAGFAAALFLLHPMQTEAVAYLAGRSEALSAMFFFAAYAVFLCRKYSAVSWGVVVAVLLLFGCAVLSKENAIALPALLLLTDYYWNPGFSFQGIRENWKLYVPILIGAVGGVAFFWDLITHATTAGFALKDFTWYQYFFTQCRALFVYLGLFVLPVHLTADWDFPISRNIFAHGAIVGLVVLLALVAAAWHYRRRYPLSSFGFFVFLVLMAPTSSILPIRDPIAERRIYAAMLGLLLIVVDVMSRVKIRRQALAAACAVVLLFAAGMTYARAGVWSTEISLWEDTVQKSPDKPRVHFQLGSAYYDAGKCDLAVEQFQRTAQLQTPNYNLLVDWALAYDCLNQAGNALDKLHEAAKLEPTAHVYSQIGMVYAKRSEWANALDALATAQKIDPSFAITYVYLGGVHLATNHAAEAVQDYQHALALDPSIEQARQGLEQAQARMRAGG
ncbi:MAG TPA: tetratricopeptide repeat protein [Bryobacteraceae bacterium]|nr:tetratricopeptide repeat protein [Bryobacteraceae bacterium]